MTRLGWREWVALPELKVAALRVKVDSGAKTSALHAENIVIVRNVRTGDRLVRFHLYPRKQRSKPIVARAPLIGYRVVKSSLGHATKRPVIQTLLRLGTEEWPIEVTLINRDIMGYRMLLGRSALKPGYVIDPQESYQLPRPVRTKEKL